VRVPPGATDPKSSLPSGRVVDIVVHPIKGVPSIRRVYVGSGSPLLRFPLQPQLYKPADGHGLGPQLVARNICPIAKYGTPDRNRA
jgi:hypothetical protein